MPNKPEIRSGQPKVAATPRRRRVIATPSAHFFVRSRHPAATGDEGVANTLLRRGVAATLPASFGVRVKTTKWGAPVFEKLI
jgi:hypothetical protein